MIDYGGNKTQNFNQGKCGHLSGNYCNFVILHEI